MVLLSMRISLRFIYGRFRNNMVLFISLISIKGIILGTAALIISLSVIKGFKRELQERILAVIPHVEIESTYQPWKKWKKLIQEIEKIPGITAAAPYVSFTGLIEGANGFYPVQIKGINPIQEEYLSILPKFISNNAWINFKPGKQQIIMGNGIVDTLKTKEKNWISVIIPNTNSNHTLQQPKHIRLHITGIFHLNSQIDHIFAMIPLVDAQKYLNIDNCITGIAIKTNNIFNIDKLVNDISNITNDYIYIKSWKNKYGYIYRDIQMIRTILYLSMALVIVIVCFNIISTLIIVMKDKIKDIAILLTFGAKKNLIRAIFFWYGLLVGLTGSFFGMIIGIFISLKTTQIVEFIEKMIGHQLISKNIYFIDFIPSELHYIDVIYSLIITVVLSSLASWYPAYRASRIDPITTLSIQ